MAKNEKLEADKLAAMEQNSGAFADWSIPKNPQNTIAVGTGAPDTTVIAVGDGLKPTPGAYDGRMERIAFVLELLKDLEGVDGEIFFTGQSGRSTIQGMIDRLERPTLEKLLISIEI